MLLQIQLLPWQYWSSGKTLLENQRSVGAIFRLRKQKALFWHGESGSQLCIILVQLASLGCPCGHQIRSVHKDDPVDQCTFRTAVLTKCCACTSQNPCVPLLLMNGHLIHYVSSVKCRRLNLKRLKCGSLMISAVTQWPFRTCLIMQSIHDLLLLAAIIVPENDF